MKNRILQLFLIVPIVLTMAGCGSSGTGGSSPTPTPTPGTQTATVTGANAPIRTRYLRTDGIFDPNSLQFAPPHFSAYDSAHRRFFVSNPFINLIDVFDAVQEIKITSLSVPGAWGIDISPDGATLYAATLMGDLYKIDTNLLTVTQRISAANIGTTGFNALEAFALADGRLALLGAQGGQSVDGSSAFAIWNPINNSIDIQGAGGTPNSCVTNIGAFAVSGDGSKILYASIDSDGTVCSFDPVTGVTAHGSFGTFISQILPSPDGRRFFAWGESGQVTVFDTSSAQVLGNISVPLLPFAGGIHGGILSRDGSTIFLVDSLADMFAFDTTSLTEKGWVANYQIADSQTTIVPGAMDETGLMIGPLGHGVAFIDGSHIQPGTQSPQIGLAFPTPSTGPVSGGTQMQVNTSSGVQNLSIFPALSSAYIGNEPMLQASTFTRAAGAFPTIQGLTQPAATNLAVDFTAVFANGNVAIMPESFSYGPTILEVIPNATTAEGGGTGALIGYGLGKTASDVHITVGGQSAPVTAFFPGPPIIPYPFPLQAVKFTLPAGAPGSEANLTLSNSFGSITAAGAIRYTNPPATFPIPAGAVLNAGVYDSHRNLYYFSDQTRVQVLSPTSGFQAPIVLSGAVQLLGLALSPDGSKLAVGDFGSQKIYLINPDAPAVVHQFALPQGPLTTGTTPTGLCVTNSGVVYFATADLNGTGTIAFHKVDTATGTFTDFNQQIVDGGINDRFIRVLQSPNGSIYSQIEGIVFRVDPSTDKITVASAINSNSGGNLELALSADGSTLATNGFLADSAMNPINIPSYLDRETFIPIATLGQKLNRDGSILFQPLTDGIDMISTATGRLEWRIELPINLPAIYDSLVVNGIDNKVLAIGDSSVVIVDLNQLAQLQPQGLSRITAFAGKHESTRFLQTVPFGAHMLARPQLKGTIHSETVPVQPHW